MAAASIVIAIDPGRSKCGVAVVRGADEVEILHRAVVPTEQISKTLADLYARHSPQVILIGNGTNATAVTESAEKLGAHIELVDEKLTSVDARKRYFRENPPRGLLRLIPTSLRTPDRPIDDLVAIILAERYFFDLENAS